VMNLVILTSAFKFLLLLAYGSLSKVLILPFFFILHHIWGFLTIFEVACSLLLFSCDEFRFSNVSIQVCSFWFLNFS
jgi:hypothetical protein